MIFHTRRIDQAVTQTRQPAERSGKKNIAAGVFRRKCSQRAWEAGSWIVKIRSEDLGDGGGQRGV